MHICNVCHLPNPALERWSSYTVMTVWKLAWRDSESVIIDEWLSHRSGCLSAGLTVYVK